MTGLRSVLAVLAAAVVVVLAPGVATAADQLSVTVKRDGIQLVSGRPAKYTITVRNPGDEPAPVNLRASLPPWLAEVSGGKDGDIGEGFVDWTVTVEPGGTAVRNVTGTYTRPEGESGSVRAAVTACAFAEEEDQPMACATDVAELNASLAPLWWLLAGVAAVLVAVAAAGRTLWRRRRSRLATPAPADA